MIALSQAEQNSQLAESIAHECRFMRFDFPINNYAVPPNPESVQLETSMAMPTRSDYRGPAPDPSAHS